jgi:hypothetical protein
MLVTVLILIAVVLVAVAAVPLVLRLIPRNPAYGVPTERTLADDTTWFRVNAFAGKAVLIACGVSALLILVYQGTWLRSGWSQFFAFLLPLAAAVGAAIAYERRTTR